MTWTDEEIKFLKAHYGKRGFSTSKIAKKLGKTKWQVFYMARKLGLMKTSRDGMLPVYLIPILEEAKRKGLIK